MSNRAVAGFFIGFVISALCLWYAFRGVDLSAMTHIMGQVSWSGVISSIILAYTSLAIRSLRWRLLLRDGDAMRLMSLVSATFIGIMANNILPARMGEVIRAWIVGRSARGGMSTALASIVVERIVDVITALAILGVSMMFIPKLGGEAAGLLVRTGLAVLVLVIMGAGAFLIAVRYRRQIVDWSERRALEKKAMWMSRAVNMLRGFLDGLAAVKEISQVALVAGLSLLIWGTSIASFQALAQGMGLGLTIVQMSLVFVIVLFGVAIPSAPGFVGTFHGFCVAGLTMVAGTEPTMAAAYATLLHGTQWLAVTLAGLAFLLMDRALIWSWVRRPKEADA